VDENYWLPWMKMIGFPLNMSLIAFSQTHKNGANIPQSLFNKNGQRVQPQDIYITLHLRHLADALIQSDLQIGAFTL
jgi:hypothetical protein